MSAGAVIRRPEALFDLRTPVTDTDRVDAEPRNDLHVGHPARGKAPRTQRSGAVGKFSDACQGKVCEHGLTWIKPSFLWMMYRSNWGTSTGQETVLAVEIDRDGFDWALRHACLSSYVRGLHPDRSTWQRDLKHAPSRVQWDPERDLNLRPLPYRSLQLGLSGTTSSRYADEWTVSISDVTPLAREIRALVSRGDPDLAAQLLPQEKPYAAGDELLAHLRP
ncbi:DUF4291 domain-containing protein [Streptomyces sp. NBC_00659]|uniref:DUF4291 domain-containing protein n=1 Tax=Streptomyces sp. NBC_00659 TaxID=2903669 RepID=UPI003FCD75B0